jgi:phosphate transport system substrate-binding protein
MSRKRLAALGLFTATALSVSSVANAQTATLDTSITVSGSGATFVSNFVEQCKADVKKGLDINISYQGIGSGGGRSGFIAGTTDFSGSDVPFTEAELKNVKDPFSYIPVTIGGVAIIFKVPGVTDLKLSAPTLAKIFAGTINKWDASDIAKENPGAALPNQTIRVIVRSDSSGTSTVFTEYLAAAGRGEWKKGITGTFPVPAGTGIAQRGSDGVTNYVAGPQGDFAITYAETSFATERKLSIAKVINTANQAVAPDPENISTAMNEAAINDDGTLLLNFNTTKPTAYPISTTSYLIVRHTMDPKKGDVLRAFLTYALGGCQAKAAGVGYAPLPKKLIELSEKAVAKINPGSAPSPTIPGAAAVAATTVAPAATTPAVVATTVAPKAAVTTKAKTTKKGKAKKVVTTKKK